MVTNDRDVTTTLRNVEDLAFNDFVKGLLVRSGASPEGVDTIFDKPALDSVFFESNPHVDWRNKPLSYFCERIIRTQLISRERLSTFQASVLERIHGRLTIDTIPPEVVVNESIDGKVISLHAWARHTILEAMTMSLYGESFLEIDPTFLNTFHRFDSESWKLTFKIPSMFAKEMLMGKRQLQHTFDKYYETSASQRADACWMSKSLEAELRAEGHSTKDVSTYLLLLYWV